MLDLLVGGAGAGLLAFAPDRFVAGSAGLADRWGMSRVMVGVLIVGFGTSAPEMLVSGLAAGQGNPEVGVGNIVGSNLANLSLILGIAALVGSLPVSRGIIRGELPVLAVATLGFSIAVQGGISRIEGGLLAVGMVGALLLIVYRSRQPVAPEDAELDAEVGEYLAEERDGARKLVALALGGLAGTVLGAQLLVTGAVGVADELGISGGFVGLTVVALGTSMPELVTAIAAARANEGELILGNLVGSNLFNSLGVGAIVGLVGGGALDDATLTVGGVGLMLAVTAAAMAAMITGRVVTRFEAVGLLATYILVMPLLAG